MHLIAQTVLTLLGMGIFFWRLKAVRYRGERPAEGSQASRASIIVPARNEAENLPALLESLKNLQPAPLEILVVDDHSEDTTGDIARQYGAKVIVPQPIPEGWIGKSWACHTGALEASGDYLLFTDADTVHAPDSLSFAVNELHRQQAGLVSYVPTHILKVFWERFQGIYHLLLLIATKAGSRTPPKRGNRRFAIGQYLLFTREAYDKVGGHEAIAHRLSEDLALGAAVGEAGMHTAVLVRKNALCVRMYPEGLTSFFAGWRRSFRDGIGTTGLFGALEMLAVIGWMLGVVIWGLEALWLENFQLAGLWGGAYLITAWLVALKQRVLGDFSWGSALTYPVFMLFFVLVSTAVLIDAARQKPVNWRGREIHLSKP